MGNQTSKSNNPFANMKIGPTKSQTSAIIMLSKHVNTKKSFTLGPIPFSVEYVDVQRAIVTCDGMQLIARFELRPNGLIKEITISGDGVLLGIIAKQDPSPMFKSGKFHVQTKVSYMEALKRAIFSNQLRDLKYANEKHTAKVIEAKVEASRPKTIDQFPDLDMTPEEAWEKQKQEKAQLKENLVNQDSYEGLL